MKTIIFQPLILEVCEKKITFEITAHTIIIKSKHLKFILKVDFVYNF